MTSRRDGDDVVGNLNYSVQGSLRQFIQNANATVGVLDVANFSIGSGPQTINVVTGAELPALAITDGVGARRGDHARGLHGYSAHRAERQLRRRGLRPGRSRAPAAAPFAGS